MPSGLSQHLALTVRQRNVLIVLLTGGIVYAGVRWAMNPTPIPDPQPEAGLRAAELADRIDPEFADWQTLAILPGIAEKKARQIIQTREARQRANPGQRAFRRVEDLYYVEGFAGATVEKLKPYLHFPSEPATMPTD